MVVPVLIIAATFACLIAAIVLVAVELARTWRDPDKSDAAPIRGGHGV